MKKKILSLIIAVLLIVPCICICVSAAEPEITILNNGQNLKYQGNNFVRFDASMVEFEVEDCIEDVNYNTVGVDIRSADYDLSPNNAIIRAYFTYNDGSILTATFINDNFYYSEYQRLTQNPDKYTIKFYYPNDNTVIADADAFYGETTNLYGDDLGDSYRTDVTANMSDNTFYINKGCLFITDDAYYYLDYAKAGITNPSNFDPYEVEGWIDVYKITDPDLCAQLDEAYSDYNDDFIGLLDGDFSTGIGIVILCIAFGVFPLATLIVFLILALRSKTPRYKKLFIAVYVSAAAELVVFAIAVLLLTVFK